MSENDDSHCAGTTEVAVMSSSKGTPEQESVQASSENRHRGCGRDVLRQSVRAAATGKARSPTVDSRVRRTVGDDEEVECSRLRAS